MNYPANRSDSVNPTGAMLRARQVFDSIKSFEDLERQFLKGAGLSPYTYTAYVSAVRMFYEFTEGKHPLTVTPADIEAFYDHLVGRRYDRNTVYYRICGLRKIFSGIAARVPGFVSPFDQMQPKLRKKLAQFRKGARTKAALTPDEICALLAWLCEHDPENYPIVLMLVTSGLRAGEICCLRWRDIECVEGQWTARFIGKGQKPAEQELYPPAVEATRALFLRKVGRDPRPEDSLYYVRRGKGGQYGTLRPLERRTLWLRINRLGARARAAGIVTRDLQWSAHLFRRSFATALYKNGMGLRAIQHLTRHATIEILATHYIDDHERAAPYFEKMLTPGAPAPKNPSGGVS